MSSIDPSMEPMLEMFIYESTTLLEQLDEIMLDSEKSKNISEDHINEIFRIMHTIKGSSAMMGIQNISNLAHAVEDVFFIIRENPDKMGIVGEAIYDIVFQASDFLKAEVDGIQTDDYTAQNPDVLIRQLETQAAIMKGEMAAAPAPAAPAAQAPAVPETPAPAAPAAAPPQVAEAPAPAAAPAAAAPAGDLHQIRVFFEDGCQMENIRAFMLTSQLKDVCDYVETVPEHPENDASLAAEIIKNGFLVKFRTTSPVDGIYKVIENSINVKSYESVDGASKPAADAAPKPQEKTAAGASAPVAGSTAAEKPPEAVAPPATNMFAGKISKQSLISVNQVKLDQLMDLVGELVTAESMVSSNPDLKGKGLVLDNFYKSTRELRKLTDELQDVVMSIRMVPLSGTFQKMNRIIRDMSRKLGKEVDLVTIGGETEVDKTINDSIADPFMHMIRNSVDHGIESPEERKAAGKPEVGKVTMAAQNVGGEIVITIADDGGGLDAEKIMKKARENGILIKPESEYTDKEIFNLIMLPGFSTNEVVTEYSGRGVGMDVVRKNIEKVGGSVTVDSVKGQGTTFTIKIPLTLAIVDGMEISVGGTIFTLPITSIRQSFKISDKNQVLHNTDGEEMILLRGDCYPVIRLHSLYGIDTDITEIEEGIVIQIENDHEAACIFADELIGEQQVVVKPFPVFLNRYNIKGTGLSGCTILGDGSISLILDANSLINSFER